MSASNPAAGPELVKASQQERHLSIHDALEYLDTIKAQFANEPEVYNNFLDIMKDFKGKRRVPLLHVAVKLYRSGRTDRVSDVRHNRLDTPGVIERVANLFHGYPNLLRGFNVFLPDGFRVEITGNPTPTAAPL